MIAAQHIAQIEQEFSAVMTALWIHIEIASQTLRLFQEERLLQEYPVSTATRGIGCQQDSYKTPYGAHTIAACIGQGEALAEIFIGRQATAKTADIERQAIATGEDLILSRILWLKGLQSGINQGAGVDSYARYIYIHGTQEEGLLGQPASHGCVRMGNQPIIDLFARVSVGTFVYIAAQ